MLSTHAECVKRCNRLKLKKRCNMRLRKSRRHIPTFVMVYNAAGPLQDDVLDGFQDKKKEQ